VVPAGEQPSARSERAVALDEILARRERHRRRPVVLRAGLVALGFLAGLVALPVVVVLPEAGVPLLIAALGLLALEFDWAAQAFAWVVWRWRQFRRWFSARSPAVRVALVAGLVAVLAGLAVLLI
jgi:hypothetical protein